MNLFFIQPRPIFPQIPNATEQQPNRSLRGRECWARARLRVRPWNPLNRSNVCDWGSETRSAPRMLLDGERPAVPSMSSQSAIALGVSNYSQMHQVYISCTRPHTSRLSSRSTWLEYLVSVVNFSAEGEMSPDDDDVAVASSLAVARVMSLEEIADSAENFPSVSF